MKVRVELRKGDWAIIAGALAIAAYEKTVEDDADLISSRVASYRATLLGRVLTDGIIVLTAAHLTERIDPRLDPYHRLVKWFRRNVEPEG